MKGNKKKFDDEVGRMNLEAQNRISEVERNFADALEVENIVAIGHNCCGGIKGHNCWSLGDWTTCRAGAFDQLEQNATNAKIPFYERYGMF
ncbi:hypothetical protein EZV62_013658 [Acer yangbiense]|uniref:Uncharacterized protein n=1 Tax=Acer yangbiense TaxID=1000413 RepID=A0A5C7HZK2_9ROSI|nr:hypothetical protein EZV62_013658 [Acer yangbiense]